MKTLRVALTTAGALVALVGGAETATWGLGPLSASVNATAPRIVAVDAGSFAGATSGAMIDATSQSIGAAPAPRATRVDYTAPPEPPSNADTDGPRLLEAPSAVSGATADMASLAAPRLADKDASSRAPDAQEGSSPQPGPAADASAAVGGTSTQTPD